MEDRQLSLNLDRFLVDPDAVRKTKGYEKSQFVLKLVFEEIECEDKTCRMQCNDTDEEGDIITKMKNMCEDCTNYFSKNNDVNSWIQIRKVRKFRDEWMQLGESGAKHMFHDGESDLN